VHSLYGLSVAFPLAQAALDKKQEEREGEIGDGLDECCFAAVSTAELEAQVSARHIPPAAHSARPPSHTISGT